MPEPRGGLPLLIPHIKGSPRPGHSPLATPSPTRRMMGAAPPTPAKPVGGAARTRALGITASWGLRILRPQAHPGLWPAPPAPAAGSVLSNSEEQRGGPSGLRRTGAGQWPQRRGRAGSAPAHVEPAPATLGSRRACGLHFPEGPARGPSEQAWEDAANPSRRSRRVRCESLESPRPWPDYCYVPLFQ